MLRRPGSVSRSPAATRTAAISGRRSATLPEHVDRGGTHVGVGMAVQQLQRTGHEQLLTRAAVGVLARVTRQCVERTRADAGVLVVEGGNEVGERLLVGEVIEDAGARAPDDGLRMPEPTANRRQRRRTRSEEVPFRLLAAMHDRESVHPSSEVVSGGRPSHRRDGTQAPARESNDFRGLVCETVGDATGGLDVEHHGGAWSGGRPPGSPTRTVARVGFLVGRRLPRSRAAGAAPRPVRGRGGRDEAVRASSRTRNGEASARSSTSGAGPATTSRCSPPPASTSWASIRVR